MRVNETEPMTAHQLSERCWVTWEYEWVGRVMTTVYNMYIFVNGPFGVNVEVHSTCWPENYADLIGQDRLWSVPWVFLVRIIHNDSRDDNMVKNLIVESIGEVRFLESFWTFNRCNGLWPVFNDHVLVNDGQVQKYYIIMTHWTGSTHSIFGWRRDHSISLSTSHLFIVWKHSIIVDFNTWLLALLTISG